MRHAISKCVKEAMTDASENTKAKYILFNRKGFIQSEWSFSNNLAFKKR